jgi:tetratricopeptide (TPR) repeat protein
VRAFRVVQALLFVFVCAQPLARAHAQHRRDGELLEIDPEKERAARGLFDAGSLAFNEGRFEDALSYFKQAYELAPKPKLLFNIGTVQDRLRRDREAVATFTEYLAKVPDAQNRAQIEARVKVLQESIDKEDALAHDAELAKQKAAAEAAAQPAPSATTNEAPAQRTTQPEAAPAEKPSLVPLLVVGGATVVVGGVALWSHLDTSSALDTYEKDPTKKHYDDGVGKQTRTNILLIGTGVLAAATGVVAYFTFASGGGSESASASASASAKLTPWFSPDGGGATAQLRF